MMNSTEEKRQESAGINIEIVTPGWPWKPLDICGVCPGYDGKPCAGKLFCEPARALTLAVAAGRIVEIKDRLRETPDAAYVKGVRMGLSMACNPLSDMLSGTSAEEILRRIEGRDGADG